METENNEQIVLPKRKKGYFSDKSSIFSLISVSMGFIIVVFLTFGATLGFKNIDTPDFWSGLAVNTSLTLYNLFCAIPEGRNVYQKKENGQYDSAFSEFIAVRREVIKKDEEFDQWLQKFYEQNRRDYFKEILSLNGNIDERVLDLDLTELDNLINPYKKSWVGTEFEGREDTYFRSLKQEQINVIKDIFNGKYAVERLPNDFFKAYNGKVISSEYIEQSKTNKKNKLYVFKKVALKLLASFSLVFVFSVLVVEVQAAQTPTKIIERVIEFISRLFTMSTAYYYGFGVGKGIAINNAETLEYKVRVNNLFLNDKKFVALTNDELGKLELEKFEKEKGVEITNE